MPPGDTQGFRERKGQWLHNSQELSTVEGHCQFSTVWDLSGYLKQEAMATLPVSLGCIGMLCIIVTSLVHL